VTALKQKQLQALQQLRRMGVVLRFRSGKESVLCDWNRVPYTGDMEWARRIARETYFAHAQEVQSVHLLPSDLINDKLGSGELLVWMTSEL
jgi:hypothetical protein